MAARVVDGCAECALAAQGAESLDEWCLKAMGAMHVHPSVTALPECVTHCTALHCIHRTTEHSDDSLA